MPHTYYRGCWHVFSGASFKGQSDRSLLNYGGSPPSTVVYNPRAFLLHAAWLHQTCVHCGRFATAASRRSLGSVSVPVWPDTLSGRLLIKALVGRYPTNKLIRARPLLWPEVPKDPPAFTYPPEDGHAPSGITTPYGELSRSSGYVNELLLTLSPLYSFPKELSRSTCMPKPRRQRSF